MDAEELRSLQTPLKERYRETPEAALVTLRARGRLGDSVTCNVAAGRALVEAGLHPAAGGAGDGACSGEMLLEALVACTGVTLNAVATALGIELRDAALTAEGDLDFRGTLGVSKEVPVGFQRIRLQVSLDTDAPDEQIATLLRLTERYCVVLQTLANPPALSVTGTPAAPGPPPALPRGRGIRGGGAGPVASGSRGVCRLPTPPFFSPPLPAATARRGRRAGRSLPCARRTVPWSAARTSRCRPERYFG